MLATQRLDAGSPVVDRIVAMAGATGDGCDDLEVAPAHEKLGVTRVAVVLGARGTSVVASRNQGPVDDPRHTTVLRGAMRDGGELGDEGRDHAMRGGLRDPER